jgi:large subunit ribosomal protein L2
MKNKRLKSLYEILAKHSGRDQSGHVAVRHQGGRQKRYYRLIDWRRDKVGVPSRVIAIEYDPNRSSDVALLQDQDGERRYILAPVGLTPGDVVDCGDRAEIKPGNCLKLAHMPVGTLVHCVEIKAGSGARMIRSAGTGAVILAKEGNRVQLKLPSGEIRLFSSQCRATVGQVGNIEWKNRIIGKAGTKRLMGIRPGVRGVAQNPRSHPHGGGEGRSGIGLPSPKSPWGKRTLGKKTRKRMKYSDAFIVQKRK